MSIPISDPESFDTPATVSPTHDIVLELTIAAAPEAVFDAITTARGRHGWWDGCDDHEHEAGQLAAVTVADQLITVRAEAVDRPEIVVWACTDGPREWVGTSITFRIEPQLTEESAGSDDDAPPAATASVVRFWHGGWPYEDGEMPRASFEWAMLLDRMRRHVETA